MNAATARLQRGAAFRHRRCASSQPYEAAAVAVPPLRSLHLRAFPAAPGKRISPLAKGGSQEGERDQNRSGTRRSRDARTPPNPPYFALRTASRTEGQRNEGREGAERGSNRVRFEASILT